MKKLEESQGLQEQQDPQFATDDKYYDPKKRARKTIIMVVFLAMLIFLVIVGSIFSYFCEPDPEMVAYTKQILKEREKQAKKHSK